MKEKRVYQNILGIGVFVLIVFLFRGAGDRTLSYVIIGFGVIGLYIGYHITSLGKRSLSWPKVDGLVRVSRVHEGRSGSSSGGTTYSFDVEYDYTVSGITYTNKTYSYRYDYNSANSRGARDLVTKYPEGATVGVFYDPSKPSNSVLLPGLSKVSYFPYGIGAGFVIIGVYLLQQTL